MGKRPSDFDLIAKNEIFGRISRRSPSSADYDLVSKAHQLRSKRARGVDEGITKNVTTIPELWMSDPARWDFKGIDTKKSKKSKAKKGGKKR